LKRVAFDQFIFAPIGECLNNDLLREKCTDKI
jgi:hypothetical protein